MTFESEGLLIVAIYIWLLPASYVVFSDNSGYSISIVSINTCLSFIDICSGYQCPRNLQQASQNNDRRKGMGCH